MLLCVVRYEARVSVKILCALVPLWLLFKTCQIRIKTCKNSMIFAQNRSKVSKNSSKFEEILQNLQFTCAFG